jgi:PPOX class probable F420-dependent enzyme
MTMKTTNTASPLQPFLGRRTALLTTYKRDGTPIATPVTIAVAGDRAFIRSFDKAWKSKRMKNNPSVQIAPSTIRGKPVGPPINAQTRLLGGEEAARAARRVARRQPILQGLLVPLTHRLMRYGTVHYELVPGNERVDN